MKRGEFFMTEIFLKNKKKYPDFLKIANEHGYKTVTEFICDSYENKFLSSNQISEQLGFYPNGVLNVLKQNGVKILGKKNIRLDSFSLDNFEKIDQCYFQKEQCDLSHILLKLNYQYVSEALCDLYFDKRNTMDEIGGLFNLSIGKISYMINKMCLPLRKKGGKTYSKLTDEIKNQIFNDFKTIEPSYKNIQQYSLNRRLKTMSIHTKSIRCFLISN